ncbi:MAG: peptidyl-tRNA hydrolase [marine bacterium B5-7]|nr:MAG: peptidyl-tRNA hydrolase [marine bacterium B5-7]
MTEATGPLHPIQLIVGLGNPGSEYAATRHNAGVWFVESLAEQYDCQFRTENKLKGLLSRFTEDGREARLLVPTTFMNHSGMAVKAVMQFYKIPPQAILVAHDELDLPTGTMRFKQGGGHGGHNGLRDIITQIGSRDFARLRIGVGRPDSSEETVNYVLKKPSLTDKQQIFNGIDEARALMTQLLQGDLQGAMHILHTSTG